MDFAVFRPANSYRYLERIAAGEFSAVGFVSPADVHVPEGYNFLQNEGKAVLFEPLFPFETVF
ncbi:MAG TPA: hypothetical protein VF721_07145 [Pyrinomonadaceae bacterium]